MADLILFGDDEQLVADYLAAHVATQPIGSKHPASTPRPAKWIRLFRTGGVASTIVTDGAQLTLECWDKTESAAKATAQQVRALIAAMPRTGAILDGHPVQRVQEISGPQNLPDPTIPDRARYTMTLVVHLRGQAA